MTNKPKCKCFVCVVLSVAICKEIYCRIKKKVIGLDLIRKKNNTYFVWNNLCAI